MRCRMRGLNSPEFEMNANGERVGLPAATSSKNRWAQARLAELARILQQCFMQYSLYYLIAIKH